MGIISNSGFDGSPDGTSYYSEVKIEVGDEIWTLSPAVCRVSGADERWVVSIDVPDGLGDIRSLFPPVFANDATEGMMLVSLALHRIIAGLASTK